MAHDQSFVIAGVVATMVTVATGLVIAQVVFDQQSVHFTKA
jgi:uncharacterized membrane protein